MIETETRKKTSLRSLTRHNLLFFITGSAIWTDVFKLQLAIRKFIFTVVEMSLVQNRLEDVVNPGDVNQLVFQTKLRVRKKFLVCNMS